MRRFVSLLPEIENSLGAQHHAGVDETVVADRHIAAHHGTLGYDDAPADDGGWRNDCARMDPGFPTGRIGVQCLMHVIERHPRPFDHDHPLAGRHLVHQGGRGDDAGHVRVAVGDIHIMDGLAVCEGAGNRRVGVTEIIESAVGANFRLAEEV